MPVAARGDHVSPSARFKQAFAACCKEEKKLLNTSVSNNSFVENRTSMNVEWLLRILKKLFARSVIYRNINFLRYRHYGMKTPFQFVEYGNRMFKSQKNCHLLNVNYNPVFDFGFNLFSDR